MMLAQKLQQQAFGAMRPAWQPISIAWHEVSKKRGEVLLQQFPC